ncbi:DUF551 domain-containing protein [Klebsiella aerogenes]
MTNNQLAENSVNQLLNSVRLARDNAERADNRVDHSFYYALTIALEELQERRKADSEPVAWTDEEELRDANESGSGYLFGIERDANKFADPRRQIMLYRHAQPAPVASFYRDGIEAAAKWLDQQREAYDSEHGWSDPDTGTFEFGNDAQRDYSSTLEELAEGIRALHPNTGNSPVIPDTWIPVSERMPEDEQEVLTINRMGHRFVSFFDKHSGLFFDWLDAPVACNIEHVLVTHWMPLPAAPQEVKP